MVGCSASRQRDSTGGFEKENFANQQNPGVHCEAAESGLSAASQCLHHPRILRNPLHPGLPIVCWSIQTVNERLR